MDNLPSLARIPRPVWLAPHTLQLWEGDEAIVLDDVPKQMRQAVLMFDGHHRMEDITGAIGIRWATWLLTTLSGLGAFDSPAPPPLLRVRTVGSGAVAKGLTALIGHQVGPPTPADVVVVAHDKPEADRILIGRLMAARMAHLIVTATEHVATVGPFVIPGTTSCVRCMDIGHTGVDPAWPLVVYQRMMMITSPPPSLVAWAAATAACHIEAHARGQTPPSASSTMTMDLTGTVHYRGWPRRHDCSCFSPRRAVA